MTPQATHALLTAALIALIAWRLYSRIRRAIGRQRLSRVRPWITIVLFPLLLALLAFGSRTQPLVETSLAAGAAAGIALGILGLRLTRFEVTAEGLFYTPSAHIDAARLAARLSLRDRRLSRRRQRCAAGSAGRDAADAAADRYSCRLLLHLCGRPAALVGAQPGPGAAGARQPLKAPAPRARPARRLTWPRIRSWAAARGRLRSVCRPAG
jgi:hypothetical protein